MGRQVARVGKKARQVVSMEGRRSSVGGSEGSMGEGREGRVDGTGVVRPECM